MKEVYVKPTTNEELVEMQMLRAEKTRESKNPIKIIIGELFVFLAILYYFVMPERKEKKTKPLLISSPSNK